jgi:hypothetical protein
LRKREKEKKRKEKNNQIKIRQNLYIDAIAECTKTMTFTFWEVPGSDLELE